MKPRILLFDPNEYLVSILKKILNDRGYDVFTFSDRYVCPLFHPDEHVGISDSVCSDIIISDLYMPTIEGLKLTKDQIDKGYKIKFRALLSTTWSDADWQYAKGLGCHLFRKPFDLKEMLEWLDGCTEQIDTERKLFNWFKNDFIS